MELQPAWLDERGRRLSGRFE